MENSPFSPPFEAFAQANAKAMPDTRFVEIVDNGDVYVIGIGNGTQCKEIVLPAEPEFNDAINRIVNFGYRGRVVFAPFEFPDETKRMLMLPVSSATAFLEHIGRTSLDVDRIFRFQAFGIDRDTLTGNDQVSDVTQLISDVKCSKNTVLETALRFRMGRDNSESIYMLNATASVLLSDRPYLYHSVRSCVVSASDPPPNEAILIVAHRRESKRTYCFSDQYAMKEANRQLVSVDGLEIQAVVQIRSGRQSLDLTALAAELSKLSGLRIKVQRYQNLLVTWTLPPVAFPDWEVQADQLLSELMEYLHLLSFYEHLGFWIASRPVARFKRAGFPFDTLANLGWVVMPHISDRTSTLMSSRSFLKNEKAQRLTVALSQTYTCYSPVDALVILWAALESCAFSESRRSRLISKKSIKEIKLCLSNSAMLENTVVEQIGRHLSGLKTKTKNELICSEVATLTGRNYEEVRAMVKQVFDARCVGAHEDKVAPEDIEGALRSLRNLVVEVIISLGQPAQRPTEC